MMPTMEKDSVSYEEAFSAEALRQEMYCRFAGLMFGVAIFVYFIASCAATIWGDGEILGIPARVSASQAPDLLVFLSIFLGFFLPVVWRAKPRAVPTGNVLIANETGLALKQDGAIVEQEPWKNLAACTFTPSGLFLVFDDGMAINVRHYPVSAKALERMALCSGSESPLSRYLSDLQLATQVRARRKRFLMPIVIAGVLLVMLMLMEISAIPSTSLRVLLWGAFTPIWLGLVVLLERYDALPLRRLWNIKYERAILS